MKVLHLTLKKKWFDMIASGEKKEEYRDMKEYWWKRLCTVGPVKYSLATILNEGEQITSLFKDYTHVSFRNGYSKDARSMTIQCREIQTGNGKPEWGAEPGKKYFVIKLGERIS
jgi:hypothetical protein